MDLNRYNDLAIRTESNDFAAIAGRAADPRIIRVLHGVIGLVTEVGELRVALERANLEGWKTSPLEAIDKVNAAEEIGDLFWYAAVLTKELGEYGTEYSLKNNIAFEHRVQILNEICDHILDHMKKVLFYGKPLDVEKVQNAVFAVVDHGEAMAVQLGTTPGEIRRKNIAKLAARYGDKFTDYAAEHRDLDAERKILEA